MSDKLVFDLASEVEGSPNVFIRKDWINILDNQNQNYNNNQSVLDTSQLSNSNKYMSYREAYFLIPFVMTIAQTSGTNFTNFDANETVNAALVSSAATFLKPSTAPITDSIDYAMGLKNWFGQIIHSFTLDYNGTTIVQQTPYINMWNSFKLMTSLSYNDLLTQGATIGFYPDDPTSFVYVNSAGGALGPAQGAPSAAGTGICNNSTGMSISNLWNAAQNYDSGEGNLGFSKRLSYINFDGNGSLGSGNVFGNLLSSGSSAGANAGEQAQTALSTTKNYANALWKSYIYFKRDQTAINSAIAGTTGAMIQIAVTATVYLKHIHSFFNMCPLLKGVFMKMTLNLNNTTTTIEAITSAVTTDIVDTVPTIVDDEVIPLTEVSIANFAAPTLVLSQQLSVQSVANSVNGVNPIMIASGSASLGVTQSFTNVGLLNARTTTFVAGVGGALRAYPQASGSLNLFPRLATPNPAIDIIAGKMRTYWTANISVGSRCLSQTLSNAGATQAPLAQSVYLYIPAYTFNPVFEQSYLSSPVKQIKYSDVYQYQVINVLGGGSGTFNNLITNGISNIKSILILPYFSNVAGSGSTPVIADSSRIINNNNTGTLQGLPVWQSPFDPAGCCATSPMIAFSNFNVQISGQNAIYNVEKYQFEHFNNQLYGQNAVNGGLTDGITSSLIDRMGFDTSYGYYYVNVERMLPVEQSVPKSVQILGTNLSSRAVDLYVFVEYGNDISIDALTGARV